ncbi:MAG: TetR/AcrR family transcriptional regulator [Porticoccaceae bacterium]
MSVRGTKDRILQTSLRLFNAAGSPAVSTNHVAIEADISPGNLYYHYKGKADIINALFLQFEQELVPLLFSADERREIGIEDLWFYLHVSFELVTKYCFVFTDTDYLTAKVPHYASRYRRLLVRKRQSLLAILNNMASQGVLAASADVMNVIATNMLLIIAHWLGFRRAIGPTDHGDTEISEFTQGVYQVISVLVPYMTPTYRDQLQTLGDKYQ